MAIRRPRLGWSAAGRALLVAVGFACLGAAAAAQEGPPASVPFEGGTFTIAENADLEKELTFDGQLLARNYLLYFDRVLELGELKVALFAVGDGGNQCGPATLIAWKRDGGGIQTDLVGEECGAPPAAATTDAIYFVAAPLPGETRTVEAWSPERRLFVAGELAFVPQPGTGWDDLDPAKLSNIVDALDNAAVFGAATKLLGAKLTGVITGLLTGGGVERTPSGILFASGCVPHACGSADAFMAVDVRGQRLFFAQQADGPTPHAWPKLSAWPADLQRAMTAALGR